MDEYPDGTPLEEGPGDDQADQGEATSEQDSGEAGVGPAETQEGAAPEPPAQWYYSSGGTSYGPVDEERLKALARQGYFQGDDYVFSSYIGDWVRADSVYGLFEEAAEPLEGAARRVAPPPVGTPQALRYTMQYAGFWIRFVAAFIDGLLLLLPSCLVMGVIRLLFFGVSDAFRFHTSATFAVEDAAAAVLALVYYAVATVVPHLLAWPYYSLMESSRWQATLGKRAVGIIVTDANGNRITFARATGRHFASFISGLMLCIGYIIGAFTERKQTLHDMIADTVVVYGRVG